MSLKHFLMRLSRASKYDSLGIMLLLGVIFALFRWTEYGADDIFFWGFALWIFWWNRDARISIALALAGLIAIPILLELERRGRAVVASDEAETVAVWVYFFLVIGVGKQIFDLIRSPPSKNPEENGEKT